MHDCKSATKLDKDHKCTIKINKGYDSINNVHKDYKSTTEVNKGYKYRKV